MFRQKFNVKIEAELCINSILYATNFDSFYISCIFLILHRKGLYPVYYEYTMYIKLQVMQKTTIIVSSEYFR